ncbi:MAG: hemolysin family protein [Ignavibacteria bacterium]|nr:hemolysin family protein [Ignavibacteria bacterium]
MEFVVMILALIGSAYFSATEIAFVVANKIKIEIRAKQNVFGAKAARKIIKNPEEVFVTILVANNIANITFASFFGLFLQQTYQLSELSTLLITTLIILTFGEIIPKAFTQEVADIAILYFSYPFKFFRTILFPIVRLLENISKYILKRLKIEFDLPQILEKEDIKILLKESLEAGAVDKEDKKIIDRVIELGDQKVSEAMRPRTEIVACDINATKEELYQIFIDSGYSKIPIYEGSLDTIHGVVYLNDLFTDFNHITEIMKPINFYPETKPSIELLKEFLSEGISIAIIVDEYGGTSGLVTTEDLIEELLGEIKDEYDIDENICRKIGENVYLISGRVENDLIYEKYGIQIPEGKYETIGGYIMNRLGKIPSEGEEFIIDNFKFTIIKATPNRIELVKMVELKREE